MISKPIIFLNILAVTDAMLRGHIATPQDDSPGERGLQMISRGRGSGGASGVSAMDSNQGMMTDSTTTPPDRSGIDDDDDGSVPISPTAPPRMCVSGEPNPFSNIPGIRTCQANSDCDGYENFDGPTCCLFPQCICGSADPGASDVMCVEDEDVPSRGSDDDENDIGDDDDDNNIVIIPIVTPPPVIRTCPVDVPNPFEGMENVRTCSVNSDCDGFENFDGPTCCLFPQCICGSPDPGTKNVMCVDDSAVPDRAGNDDDSNPVVAPPEPEPMPEPILTCPSNVSDNYQFLNGVRACSSNADCEGFENIDGLTCCLYPLCVCGNPTPGASGNIKCLA